MPGVGKVRARQIMEEIGISESRRVRGLGANRWRRSSGSSAAAPEAEARSSAAADRAVRALRGGQGHGRRGAARRPPRDLAVGVGDHADPPTRRGRRRALPLRQPTSEFDAAGRRAASCSSGPSSLATATAPRGSRCSTHLAPAARCCWRSSCRAPARSGRDAGGAAGLPGPAALGRAGPPAGRARHRGRGRRVERRLAAAREELAAEPEFDVTMVNDDVRRRGPAGSLGRCARELTSDWSVRARLLTLNRKVTRVRHYRRARGHHQPARSTSCSQATDSKYAW